MPALPETASLATWEATMPEPTAIAICGKCGAADCAFRIVILACGCTQARCHACGEIWEAPDRGSRSDAGGDQAVDGIGDEPENVVPAKSLSEARDLIRKRKSRSEFDVRNINQPGD